jgi:hypothetical protein
VINEELQKAIPRIFDPVQASVKTWLASNCLLIILVTVLAFVTGAAKPNIIVLISRTIIQIQGERAGIRRIIPIATASESGRTLVLTATLPAISITELDIDQ